MVSTTDLRAASDPVLVHDPVDVDRLPWQPVIGCAGVHEKELWRSGEAVDALIRYQPGACTPGRQHSAAHHHIWVLAGAATIGDRRVMAGSYVHVPPAVEHPVHGVGPEGCTLLQMHRPDPPR